MYLLSPKEHRHPIYCNQLEIIFPVTGHITLNFFEPIFPDVSQFLLLDLLIIAVKKFTVAKDSNLMFGYRYILGTRYPIVRDGFYPYYTRQKPKILFIARESVGLGCGDYIGCLHDAYVNEKRIGERKLNAAKFHRIIFYLSYALAHGLCEYDEIPYPEDVADDFASPGGLSFAFMNISKIDNKSGDWRADWGSIWKSVNDSPDFIRREISLLAPDVIIAGFNDMEIMKKVFPEYERLGKDEWDTFVVNVDGRRTRLINNWHFSALYVSDKTFYDIVCDSMERYSDI